MKPARKIGMYLAIRQSSSCSIQQAGYSPGILSHQRPRSSTSYTLGKQEWYNQCSTLQWREITNSLVVQWNKVLRGLPSEVMKETRKDEYCRRSLLEESKRNDGDPGEVSFDDDEDEQHDDADREKGNGFGVLPRPHASSRVDGHLRS